MKMSLVVDNKKTCFRVCEMVVRSLNGEWELGVKVIEDKPLFPLQEKLLILAKGTESAMNKMMGIIKHKDGISSHEDYLEILRIVTRRS